MGSLQNHHYSPPTSMGQSPCPNARQPPTSNLLLGVLSDKRPRGVPRWRFKGQSQKERVEGVNRSGQLRDGRYRKIQLENARKNNTRKEIEETMRAPPPPAPQSRNNPSSEPTCSTMRTSDPTWNSFHREVNFDEHRNPWQRVDLTSMLIYTCLYVRTWLFTSEIDERNECSQADVLAFDLRHLGASGKWEKEKEMTAF